MTTRIIPMAKINEAFDLLQNEGVLSDNLADHEFGCWMEELALTTSDLRKVEVTITEES